MNPSFLQQLFDDRIQTVLLAGCGGGFDFVHGTTLIPELLARGKRIVIHSYSFGDPDRIPDAPVVFDDPATGSRARLVQAGHAHDPHYAPEVHLADFLDTAFPQHAPHQIYASYARNFTVPVLRDFYTGLVERHQIDAVVLIDGGSDSLMVGDEAGLGDPIEDAVSVAAVAALSAPETKLLVSIGFGADRFNQVSDAASLRAVAELTATGGFLGAVSLESRQPGFQLYRAAIEHIYERQTFRSALSGFILSAGEGHFGSEIVPSWLASRVQPGGFFVWPLMAMAWGFDVEAVAERSRVVDWIRDCTTVRDCHIALYSGRECLPVREIEDLPRQREMQR